MKITEKINIGIVGYGNVGKGVEKLVEKNDDINVVGIFTRRNPRDLKSKYKSLHISEIKKYIDKIDVLILCGGSATDLPLQTVELAKYFNVVDSFDTHAKIEDHYKKVEVSCNINKTVAFLSIGWDPGLFSMIRLLGNVILPKGNTYTFWGPGVSQGHSDAIRRIKGVKKGIQYTIPIEESLKKASHGEKINSLEKNMHKRVCYIVAEENADLNMIEKEIKNMPNYFVDYNTDVNFISEEEFESNHKKMPHGGVVICTGTTGEDTKETIKFSLKLESNPEFTASILIAYARAAYRFEKEGKFGVYTVFDIPLSYLSTSVNEDLRKLIL